MNERDIDIALNLTNTYKSASPEARVLECI